MTKQEASDLLDLVIARAPELREAGIRSVELGGLGFTLAPPELAPDDTGNDQEDDGPADALHDPWTFGRPAAGTPKALPKRKRTPL